MGEQLHILAVISGDSVFEQIEPLMSRTDLRVSRVRRQHALTLAHDLAYDLILSQHPLADVSLQEFLSSLRSGDCDSHRSPVLILTRDTRLDSLTPFLDGVGVQACCIDAAPEQLEKALIELVGLAVRVKARVFVELKVDFEEERVNRLYQAVNISESGLLLCSSQPPSLGTEIPLTLHLPDESEPIRAIGKVARYTRPAEDVQGAGLRLLKVEADGRERLAEFIAHELSRTSQQPGSLDAGPAPTGAG